MVKPMTLLDIHTRLKGPMKYRVRRTEDLTDHLITGVTKYAHEYGDPLKVQMINLQNFRYSDTPTSTYGFVLLSSPDEIESLRPLQEYEVIRLMKVAYHFPVDTANFRW